MISADIRQCKDCGRLFQSLGSGICPECHEARDREFIKVRDYIYAHPDAKVLEIANATGVSDRMILEFIKEERLAISAITGLVCENCKKPINSGRYCEACREYFKRVFSGERVAYTPPGGEKRQEPPDNGKYGIPSRRQQSMHLKFGDSREEI